MKVYLGTDHAGFALKEKVRGFLMKKGYEVVDCGSYGFDKDDDFPDFVGKAADGVSRDPEGSKGIVFGGSGQGEAMLANKYRGVRCVLFYGGVIPVAAVNFEGKVSNDSLEIVRLTREHNNANMLSLGVRFLREEEALKAVELWLGTGFSGEERHVRRITKIENLELKLYV